jgi:ferritin
LLNKYLDDNEVKQIQNAYYHEISNSIIYSNLSIWLMSKGLVNLSKYYQDWSNEEKKHSEWVREFMMNLDIPIIGGTSSSDNYNLDLSLQEFANVTLQREDLTTKIYKDMMISCLDMNNLGDSLLMTFILKMSSEQLEETDKALTLFAKVNNITSFGELQIFDNTFGD